MTKFNYPGTLPNVSPQYHSRNRRRMRQGRAHSRGTAAWSTHSCCRTDGNGNVTRLTDASQVTIATYRYEPFGNTSSSGYSYQDSDVNSHSKMKNKPHIVEFTGICGHLQVVVGIEEGRCLVYLDGDKRGLLSLAKLASELAELDQAELPSLPNSGAAEHVHLQPGIDLASSSSPLIIGRLDDKMGNFDVTFKPRLEDSPRKILHEW